MVDFATKHPMSLAVIVLELVILALFVILVSAISFYLFYWFNVLFISLICIFILALNALSCEAHRNTHTVDERADITVDIDGSGPLPPFRVTCEFEG